VLSLYLLRFGDSHVLNGGVSLPIVLFAVTAYPILLYATYLIPEPRLRLWVGIVVVLGLPAWLMCGYIALGVSSRSTGQDSSNPPSRDIRIRGGVVLVVGFVAWCSGAFLNDWLRYQELLPVGVALYGLLLGSYWLLTGRRLA